MDETGLNTTPPVRDARLVLLEGFAIGLLALVLNLAGNGRVSLWDRDEPRYAGCTREMRASGDLIHPTFNAEPRYHKPVLIYWLMLAGTAIGGDNPFGARLVSSCAGAATVLLLWMWGRRMLGERAGRLAALVLATAPIIVAESKLATTDATLMLWVVGCQFLLWELSRRPSRLLAGLFWVILGLAILTKSPAGPALIAASAVASWWWGGPTACWRRLCWRWGPLLALAIALPWNVAILFQSHGEYYNVAIGYHIIQRATTGLEEHGAFPGYYLVTGLATFFPWSAFLPAAIAAAWARRREDSDAGFLLGWLIGPLIFLECVRTKLIHYYLPAFPAAALLVGWLLARVASDSRTAALWRWRGGRAAFRSLAGFGVVLVLACLAGGFLLPGPMRAPSLILGLLGAFGLAAVLYELRTGRTERATLTIAGAMALSLVMVSGWVLPAAEPYRLSTIVGRKLATLEQREVADAALCSFQTPGTVYALGHPAPLLRSRAGIVDAAAAKGKFLTALMPEELKIMSGEPSVLIQVKETVRGFNIEKARNETVHLAVIRSNLDQLGVRPRQGVRR